MMGSLMMMTGQVAAQALVVEAARAAYEATRGDLRDRACL
jgi:hypothetical protein